MPRSQWAPRVRGPAITNFSYSKQVEFCISYHSTVNPEAEGILRIRYLESARIRSHVKLDAGRILLANIEDCEHGSRGWTYQEFTMATWFLAFGRSELCFSCPSGAEYIGSVAITGLKFHLGKFQ